MKYETELTRSMDFLAKDKRTIFLGQAVACPGTGMTNTLKNISEERLYEFPVAEEMQMGVTIGLALNNFIPVSIYPRWNFLLLATNQIVNHLDKIKVMSNGKFKTKTIIRTSVGSERPLHPQYQHVGDFSDPIQKVCKEIEIIRLEEPKQIFPAYEKALLREDGKSTILVEYGDFYNEK